MIPKWDLDQLAHDHRAGQNFALLFDLVEPAAHRQDAVQRVDDRVGVEQPLHSFGGSLLPPAARVSRKMRKICSGDSPFQPPPIEARNEADNSA